MITCGSGLRRENFLVSIFTADTPTSPTLDEMFQSQSAVLVPNQLDHITGPVSIDDQMLGLFSASPGGPCSYISLTPDSSRHSLSPGPPVMSNFFSDEAQRALEGNEEEQRRLFRTNSAATYYPPLSAPSALQPSMHGYSPSTSSYHPSQQYPSYNQWMALPLYSQIPSASYTTAPPSTIFPAFDSPSTHASTAISYIHPSTHLPQATTQQHQHHQPYQSPNTVTIIPPDPSTTYTATSTSSRSDSPNPTDLHNYGVLSTDGTWRCAFPACSSRAIFTRGCDLRKHFNRHSKHLFCRHDGCPQSSEGGFSSKKDRARHEAKHNPGVMCEWDGCGRMFSRVDNMKDHVRRIHRKGPTTEAA